MAEKQEILDALTPELRRGTVVLSVLSQLEQPMYGYALVQVLEEKGMAIEANTLYPLLRRLEKQELLKSEWDVGESKPRKYYSLTMLGRAVYADLKTQWNEIVEGMKRLTGEGGETRE